MINYIENSLQSDEIIEGLLQRKEKLMVAAPPKTGKSFFLMNLAVCLAKGKSFFRTLLM